MYRVNVCVICINLWQFFLVLHFFLSFFLSSIFSFFVCLFVSFILPSWHGLVQSVPLKSDLLAWLIQERILFWLVFGRLNAHFYRRCWKWDPCESLHFCAHVIMLRYTLNKTVTSLVPYCALCWNTAIGKLLSKHCMCFLDGFCLHSCFYYGIPFLQRIQHSGEQTNAMHQRYPQTLSTAKPWVIDITEIASFNRICKDLISSIFYKSVHLVYQKLNETMSFLDFPVQVDQY